MKVRFIDGFQLMGLEGKHYSSVVNGLRGYKMEEYYL